MLSPILLDAGPLIALFDSSERHHRPVKAFLKDHPYRYVSTIAVFTEVSHMLDFNTCAQRDFYEWVMYKGVIISDINQHDLPRLVELTQKYADLPMDFADATLVITAEKTGIREIISLDKDFDIYRLPGKEQIRNVYSSVSSSSTRRPNTAQAASTGAGDDISTPAAFRDSIGKREPPDLRKPK